MLFCEAFSGIIVTWRKNSTASDRAADQITAAQFCCNAAVTGSTLVLMADSCDFACSFVLLILNFRAVSPQLSFSHTMVSATCCFNSDAYLLPGTPSAGIKHPTCWTVYHTVQQVGCSSLRTQGGLIAFGLAKGFHPFKYFSISNACSIVSPFKYSG